MRLNISPFIRRIILRRWCFQRCMRSMLLRRHFSRFIIIKQVFQRHLQHHLLMWFKRRQQLLTWKLCSSLWQQRISSIWWSFQQLRLSWLILLLRQQPNQVSHRWRWWHRWRKQLLCCMIMCLLFWHHWWVQCGGKLCSRCFLFHRGWLRSSLTRCLRSSRYRWQFWVYQWRLQLLIFCRRFHCHIQLFKQHRLHRGFLILRQLQPWSYQVLPWLCQVVSGLWFCFRLQPWCSWLISFHHMWVGIFKPYQRWRGLRQPIMW